MSQVLESLCEAPSPVLSEIDFDGQVAVVTGAGNGLGRRYALDLAKRGASVVVNDLGCSPSGMGASGSAAESVVAEIRAGGGKAVASFDTVATPEGGAAIVNAALQAFGRIDILISNAGFIRNAAFENLTPEQIRSVIDVHLLGSFHVAQPAYRAMQRQGYGRLVLTASAAALYGHAWQANYAAAKAGVVGLTHVLAIEGAAQGILANCVLPISDTRLARTQDWAPDRSAQQSRYLPMLASALQPEFVSPLVVFLASRKCTTTHGIYSASAGRYARVFIGTAEGWQGPREKPCLPEDVAAHLGEIEDTRHFTMPLCICDEFDAIGRAIEARAPG